MAKQLTIGISNVARKGKKAWIGIDGVARKIKKMWIGVNGIARLFFSGGGVATYSGLTTALTTGRAYHAGASIGDYAVFVAGQVNYGSYPGYYHSYTNTIETYNTALTHSVLSKQSYSAVRCMGVANVGNYTLFAGGYSTYSDDSSNSYTSAVTAIDTSLTVTTNTPNLTLGSASQYTGASNGSYALFRWGGYTVYTYNSSLTKSSFNSSDYNRDDSAGTSIGNYAIFAGGGSGATIRTTCEVYNSSLTRSTINLANNTYRAVGVSTENYALITGGIRDYGVSNIVDAIDASLTRSTASALATSVEYHAGCAIQNSCAIIATSSCK